jgi:type IV pilus modification protein PilV
MEGTSVMRKPALSIQKIRSREEGFSLIESVVAIFLLAVGLLSAASVLVTASKHQKISSVFTTATNLSEEMIETMRHQKYVDMAAGIEDFGEITDNITFRREVVVTPNAEDTMKTVEVTVRHLGGQAVLLQTLIAR